MCRGQTKERLECGGEDSISVSRQLYWARLTVCVVGDREGSVPAGSLPPAA